MQKIIPITDLQRAAGQIVTGLNVGDDSSIVITQRGRPAAVLISADHYARIESDLERLDELELIEMVESARKARASRQTLSHDEVKKHLSKSKAEVPKRAVRARK